MILEKEYLELTMNVSTPKPRKSTSSWKNEGSAQTSRQRDHHAVIENDWVPATQPSAMSHAQSVRLAGPLRPMWYVDGAKNLLFKAFRPARQTA